MAENENKIVDLERLQRNNVKLRNRELYKRDLGELGYLSSDGRIQTISPEFVEHSGSIATSIMSDGMARFDLSQSYYGYWDPIMSRSSGVGVISFENKPLDSVLKITIDGKSDLYHVKHESHNTYGAYDYYGCYPMGGIFPTLGAKTHNFCAYVYAAQKKLRFFVENPSIEHTVKVESVDLGIVYGEITIAAGEADTGTGTYFISYDCWFGKNDFMISEDSLIDFSVDGAYYPDQSVTLDVDAYGDDCFYVGNMHILNDGYEDNGVPMCLEFPLWAIEDGHPSLDDCYVRFAEPNKQHEFAFGKLKKVQKSVVEHLDDEDAVNGIAEADLFDVATDADGNVLIAGDNVYGW